MNRGKLDIERVKQEIRTQAAGLTDRPILARRDPPAPGDNGIDRSRLQYRIGELTDAHHVAFIDNAFRALLKRFPDPAEADAQLRLLAAGKGKPEVLGNLRYSPEGRRTAVRVDGLFARYALAKLRRVPVIGYLVEWALTLAALPMIVRHQRATEALFAAGDHAAAEADRAVNARINQLETVDAVLRERLGELQLALNQVHEDRRALVDALASTSKILNDRYDEMAFLRQRLYALNHWGHSLTQAFARIDEAAAERIAQLDAFAAKVALEALAKDRTRDMRNAAWLESLAPRLPPHADVMALACGSDWLSLLNRHGARLVAIEPIRALADDARAAGIAVEQTQAAEALRRIADASADAMTILALPSVLRRMPVSDLFGEARRVLRPGGSLLLAFASEPAAIVDALLEPMPMSPDPVLLTHALSLAGFGDVVRTDAADGTVALLARSAQR
jgi:SAM-dependent methyltransferase